jgi:K(+)-stimulated pyrophosphate-energized sodium pump
MPFRSVWSVWCGCDCLWRDLSARLTHAFSLCAVCCLQTGAKAFLRYEYTALFCMVAILFVLVSVAVHPYTGLCYLAGSITSATCGFLGMMIATSSNARTCEAAKSGLNSALRVAFNSGSVMV